MNIHVLRTPRNRRLQRVLAKERPIISQCIILMAHRVFGRHSLAVILCKSQFRGFLETLTFMGNSLHVHNFPNEQQVENCVCSYFTNVRIFGYSMDKPLVLLLLILKIFWTNLAQISR